MRRPANFLFASVLVPALLWLLSGCSQQEGGQSPVRPSLADDKSLPSGHPPLGGSGEVTATALHPATKGKATLALSADVKAKWKAVELSIAASSGQERKVQVPVGGTIPVEHSGLTIQVVAFVPAYQSDAKTITSAGNAPDNPAVLIQLLNQREVISQGWVFQKLPDFNTFNSDKVKIRLMAGLTVAAKP